MSGIVAIYNLDGRPVDSDLLWSMTNYMRYRGPDDQRVWIDGSVGFGHTMLRTTFEQAREQQPCSLDGRVWITADARIDGRDELKQQMAAKGQAEVQDPTDVELILRAYQVWGEDCVDHLIGDFAFVLWDETRNVLLFARDHFGIKPLFFVKNKDLLLVCNTLNCLRTHPSVTNNLDHEFISSFLLRGYNEYPDKSAFVDIKRVRPGQVVLWDGDSFIRRFYWSIPVDEPLNYRNPDQYVEEFRELLSVVVNDRLRSEKIAISMSAGLDSTSIAALARLQQLQQSREHKNISEIIAFTATSPDTLEYDESDLAKMTAEFLGIRFQQILGHQISYFEDWDNCNWNTPEPSLRLLSKKGTEIFAPIQKSSRVLFTGFGGDPVFYPSSFFLHKLVSARQFSVLISSIGQYYKYQHKLPPLYIRSTFLKYLRGKSIKNFFNQDYKKSISAGGDRNKSHSQISIPIERYIVHPWRQEAVDRLNSSWWTILFEEYDPGTSGWILETRYPFFDIRLVNFTLRLPTVPWCVQKEVLRQAMKGLLPGPILRRPKSSMPPNIYSNKVQDCVGLSWLGDLHDIPGLSDFIDVESAIDTLNSLSYDHKVTNFDPVRILYPFVLGYWLKNNNSYQNFSPKGDLLK